MNRKKIMIIGLECGGIPQSIAKAFRSIGWDAALFTYGAPRMNLLQLATLRVVDPHCDKITRSTFNQCFRTGVFPELRRNRPDFLLVLKGDYFDDDVRDFLTRAEIPLVLWTFDSLFKAPAQRLLAEMAVHTFYVDGGDVPAGGYRSSWLPLGYDGDIYHPYPDIEKTIDVLLIGFIGIRYKRRRQIIDLLDESVLAQKWRCAFIGSTGTLMGNLSLQLHYGSAAHGRVTWLSRRIPPESLALAIAKSKICINIHQDDGIMPVNPMFFAIPATGTCQLAEQKPHLRQWLVPGRHYAEFTDGNFLEVLSGLLDDDKKRTSIVKNGIEACRDHTFISRVKSIVSVIERVSC